MTGFTKVKEVTKGPSGVSVFRYGTGDRKIKVNELVMEYLTTYNIKYGESIDTFDVMSEFGIVLTPEIESDGKKYLMYFNLAKTLGEEFVNQLTMFGYKADKKKKPASEGFDNNRHINRNVVYTNWPWTVVSKAVKAAEESMNAMKGVHDDGIDMSEWEEQYPEEYALWRELAADKISFAKNDMNLWKDSFDEKAYELLDFINLDIEEKKDTFRKLQPKNYGRYK
jgi:hypothetical protein